MSAYFTIYGPERERHARSLIDCIADYLRGREGNWKRTMRTFRIPLPIAIVAAMGSVALAHLQTVSRPANLTGLHDFDFLLGEWLVHHRVKRPAHNSQMLGLCWC